MSLSITFLGHAGFLLDDGTKRVAIDPFLSGNPLAPCTAEQIECSHILITHGHADHFSDTVAIAKRTGAAVIAGFEICEYLGEQGIEAQPCNPGARVTTDFGWVAATHAIHSSSFEGRYMGVASGLVVNMGGTTIYDAGDTDLFSDMKLIGEIYQPDIAIIPIGDVFTMGPELGARAAEFVGAPIAIPMHYDTWPPIAQDPSTFAPKGIEVKVLAAGEAWSIER